MKLYATSMARVAHGLQKSSGPMPQIHSSSLAEVRLPGPEEPPHRRGTAGREPDLAKLRAACVQQESVYREARRQRGPPHGTNLSSTLSPDYDYFSLISLLDASPSLETWRLEVRCYPSYISSKLIYVATNLGAFIDSISWFYIVLGS
jgi:hypothetical protein